MTGRELDRIIWDVKPVRGGWIGEKYISRSQTEGYGVCTEKPKKIKTLFIHIVDIFGREKYEQAYEMKGKYAEI